MAGGRDGNTSDTALSVMKAFWPCIKSGSCISTMKKMRAITESMHGLAPACVAGSPSSFACCRRRCLNTCT